MNRDQIEIFITLDGLVLPDHPDRRFEDVADFCAFTAPLRALYVRSWGQIVRSGCLYCSFSKTFRTGKRSGSSAKTLLRSDSVGSACQNARLIIHASHNGGLRLASLRPVLRGIVANPMILSISAGLVRAQSKLHPLASGWGLICWESSHLPRSYDVAAALPVAGNVYILAQHFDVAQQRVSAAILLSMAASIQHSDGAGYYADHRANLTAQTNHQFCFFSLLRISFSFDGNAPRSNTGRIFSRPLP